MPIYKIVGGPNNQRYALGSIHGLGTGVEKLHARFIASGGIGGEAWTKKHPFHKRQEGDGFSLWCEQKGITLAKSPDGAWAIAVKTDSTLKRDKAGYPLAHGAKKVMWLTN